jgi:hypothetical protein
MYKHVPCCSQHEYCVVLEVKQAITLNPTAKRYMLCAVSAEPLQQCLASYCFVVPFVLLFVSSIHFAVLHLLFIKSLFRLGDQAALRWYTCTVHSSAWQASCMRGV